VKEDDPKVKPLPLLIGPRNCEAVCGLPWRHVRENARSLGVPVLLIGRKAAVPAAAFLAAAERQEAEAQPEKALPPTDPAEAVRQILRRAGGQ
jgi:hypothetical protein